MGSAASQDGVSNGQEYQPSHNAINSRARFHAVSALSTHQGQREYKCSRWYVHALMPHETV